MKTTRQRLSVGFFFLTFALIWLNDFCCARELPLVVVVSTGGTIASKTDADGGAVPVLSGDSLTAGVPELKNVARIRVIDFCQLDSSQMNPQIWAELSRTVDQALTDNEVAGVVVTHGTDTMAEGAFFLDCTIKSGKPVVFTGAMRDASAPGAEGPCNLLNAVIIAVSPLAQGGGVVVCLNEYIHSAKFVTKKHTTNVQAFFSGQRGLWGQVYRGTVFRYAGPAEYRKMALSESFPPVPLICTYSGDDGALIRSAVAQGAKGMVVEALGAGNVNEPVYQAIVHALSQKVEVVITSRVEQGGVWPVYGGPGGGATLQKAGCILGGDLPGPKARLVLMLALGQGTRGKELQKYFTRNGAWSGKGY